MHMCAWTNDHAAICMYVSQSWPPSSSSSSSLLPDTVLLLDRSSRLSMSTRGKQTPFSTSSPSSSPLSSPPVLWVIEVCQRYTCTHVLISQWGKAKQSNYIYTYNVLYPKTTLFFSRERMSFLSNPQCSVYWQTLYQLSHWGNSAGQAESSQARERAPLPWSTG